MGFFKLNRYGHASGLVFEPEQVLQRVRETFPDARVVPGEQLALAAERATTAGAAEHVIQRLRRNEQTLGPAYAFTIPVEGGTTIEGRARRYDVTFLFSEPLPGDWHKRLLSFLREFGPGKLELAKEISPAETLDV